MGKRMEEQIVPCLADAATPKGITRENRQRMEIGKSPKEAIQEGLYSKMECRKRKSGLKKNKKEEGRENRNEKTRQ